MNGSGGWMRSPAALILLWAALAMSLVLGVGLLVVHHRTPELPGAHDGALTDAQAASQVVDSAKAIVAAARLQQATGGYMFVSCTNEKDPPFQATFYMNFVLPQNNSVHYLTDVASAMIADGWTDAPADGENFGQKLSKGGVTSVFYRNPSNRGYASMRLYGECRNTTDHHADDPVWTEVSL